MLLIIDINHLSQKKSHKQSCLSEYSFECIQSSLILQFQKKYPTHSIVPRFVRLKSLRVDWISDSQIFDEKIRGKVKEMVTCLLQNSLHAKVDIILKSGSTYRY
jgi:hypothetical protein